MKTYSIQSTLHYLSLVVAFAATAMLLPACEDDPVVVDEQLTTKPDTGTETEPETFRFISYNILEGMKLDKDNNFDNFVAWVQAKDPDFMALQECNGLTQETLTALAARYGHPHALVCKEEGYSVGLTSKYPIELRNRLLSTEENPLPLYHGAIFTRIKDINVVVLHLYPFGAALDGMPNGDAYRTREINYILDNTIRRYPAEPLWLMSGDFNSYSAKDADALGERYYDTHNTVLQSGYYDVIRDRHNYFMRTTPTVYGKWVEGVVGSRLDFIYCSKNILRQMTSSDIIYDDFTNNYSDHYPVMIEFRHYPSGK
ncbi:MAG: endonuclease/exonuclease/phosphatase family protein [Alistipes sp.]